MCVDQSSPLDPPQTLQDNVIVPDYHPEYNSKIIVSRYCILESEDIEKLSCSDLETSFQFVGYHTARRS